MQNDNINNWAAFKNGDDKAASRINTAANINKPAHSVTLSKQNKTKFCFVSVDEMEIKEPEFLIAGLMEIQNLALIFGEPACGKSFIAIDMACCIATGRPFHGYEVKQGLVFYIAGEGHQGLKRRFAAWEKHHHVEGLNNHVFISNVAGNLVCTSSTQEIITAIQELTDQHGEATLIVVDTVARSFGSGDENSQKDMGTFVSNADSLKAKFPNSTVMLVHHSGHADKNRSRGSSALKGAVDAEYKVSKSGNIITFTNQKMKDSEPPEPLYFELETIELGATQKGKPYSSAVLRATEKAVQSSSKVTGNDLLALEALKTAISANGVPTVSKKQWREEFDKLHPSDKVASKAAAFRRALDGLVESGSVIALEDDLYSLP